jgi:hypothetical protein
MSLAITLIILVCLILLGAITPKPIGWVVVALAVLALLLVVLGGVTLSVGR